MTSSTNSASLPGKPYTKRLRVFAGPNGSGKTTIIEAIRNTHVGSRPIDFGIYINADDINSALLNNTFTFQAFQLDAPTRTQLVEDALNTGLIGKHFPEQAFKDSFTLNSNGEFKLKGKTHSEYLAQVLATVIREYLLHAQKKLSFETVFSHSSKIEFMKKAAQEGYKVYLYFIATESPEINIARIKEVRVKLGGHDVSADKIRARYQRSLELLFAAAQHAYQAYFFDNSSSSTDITAEYFAHFKVVRGRQVWDDIDYTRTPEWFVQHYLGKL